MITVSWELRQTVVVQHLGVYRIIIFKKILIAKCILINEINYYYFISNLIIKVRGHDTLCLYNHDLNLQKEFVVYLTEQYITLFQQVIILNNCNEIYQKNYLQLSSE